MSEVKNNKDVVLFIGSIEYAGTERQLVKLANGLNAEGVKVSIVTLLASNSTIVSRDVNKDICVIPLLRQSSLRYLDILFPFIWLSRFIKIIKERDAVIIYSMLELTNFIAFIVNAFISKSKLVWGVRSTGIGDSLKVTIPFVFCKYVSGMVVNAIANSNEVMQFHIDKGFKCKNWTVINNGVNTDEYKYEPKLGKSWREKIGIADEVVIIGLVARVHPLKAHDVFLKAASIYCQHHNNIKFICVGEAADKELEELQNLSISLGLENKVIWIGKQENMVEIYNAIDVLTLTSKSEGFPNVLIEGMSCGVPCVSTDVSDVKEIISVFGKVVPIDSPDELASAWSSVVSDYKSGNYDPSEIRNYIIDRYSERKMIKTTQMTLNSI
jgi:glycosyltransferase involved in cell wall biosynthesis